MRLPQDQDEWVEIGIVGVDSGQLMITDPCYVGTEWKTEAEGGNLRLPPIFLHKDGTALFCATHGGSPPFAAIPFVNFEEVIPKYGKTPNVMIAEGELVKRPKSKPCGEYSYRGCCEATLDEAQAGQLNFARTNLAGAGVVFSSGLGDGNYQVLARYVDLEDWGRRVAEVRILLIDDEEDDEEDDESTTT